MPSPYGRHFNKIRQRSEVRHEHKSADSQPTVEEQQSAKLRTITSGRKQYQHSVIAMAPVHTTREPCTLTVRAKKAPTIVVVGSSYDSRAARKKIMAAIKH